MHEVKIRESRYGGRVWRPAPTRCRVCGFLEVRTDEVVDRGVVLLAECPRCDHRWTSRLAAPTGLATIPVTTPALAAPLSVRPAPREESAGAA